MNIEILAKKIINQLEESNIVIYNIERCCFYINKKQIIFNNDMECLLLNLKENITSKKSLYKLINQNSKIMFIILGRDKLTQIKKLIRDTNKENIIRSKSFIKIYTTFLNAERNNKQTNSASVKEYSDCITYENNMLIKLKEWESLPSDKKYNIKKIKIL